MKRLVLLLLTILCIVVFISLNESKSGKHADGEKKIDGGIKVISLELGFAGSSGELKGHEKAIEGIEKVLYNVKVKLKHYPTDKDLWDNLPIQIAAQTAPDVISATNEEHLEFILSGLFLPIDTSQIDLSGITKNAIDAWNIAGKQYGIPYTAAPSVFIINMDMWNAAGLTDLPKTWDDVKNTTKVLTRGDVKGICISDHAYHLTQYALSFGGGWDFGKTIDSPVNVKALQFCIDMFREGYAVTPKQVGLGWDGEVFANRKCAMTTGGTWYIGFLKDAAPDLNYKIVPIPNGPDGTKGCTLHSIAYAVLKNVKDEKLVFKALDYMVRDEAQEFLMNTVGSIPSSIKASKKYFESHSIMINIMQQLEYAKPFRYPVASRKFIQALLKGFEEAIYVKDSERTAQDILSEVHKEFNK